MRQVTVACLVISCAVVGRALADENEGGGKAAVADSSVLIVSTHMVPPDSNGATFVSPWITVLSTEIEPPSRKDLLIAFSAETILANLSGQGGSGPPLSATFTHEVNDIQARILVDGVPAAPGAVVYDGLTITLNAALANPITSCREVADVGPMAGVVTCPFGPDFLGQLMETAGVRNFNFITRDVSTAKHVIAAQVRFVATNFRSPDAAPNSSAIAAVVGARTLAVEQVMGGDPRPMVTTTHGNEWRPTVTKWRPTVTNSNPR